MVTWRLRAFVYCFVKLLLSTVIGMASENMPSTMRNVAIHRPTSEVGYTSPSGKERAKRARVSVVWVWAVHIHRENKT